MKKQTKELEIIKSETPESIELLASSIVQVSEASKKMLNSGLRKRAIILLLQDIIGTTKITKGQILLVLDNLTRLDKMFTNSLDKK